MNDLCRLSASDAAKKLARREITATQYLQACLERIDERERDVRAFAYLGREQAVAAARALDAGPVRVESGCRASTAYRRGLPPARETCRRIPHRQDRHDGTRDLPAERNP